MQLDINQTWSSECSLHVKFYKQINIQFIISNQYQFLHYHLTIRYFVLYYNCCRMPILISQDQLQTKLLQYLSPLQKDLSWIPLLISPQPASNFYSIFLDLPNMIQKSKTIIEQKILTSLGKMIQKKISTIKIVKEEDKEKFQASLRYLKNYYGIEINFIFEKFEDALFLLNLIDKQLASLHYQDGKQSNSEVKIWDKFFNVYKAYKDGNCEYYNQLNDNNKQFFEVMLVKVMLNHCSQIENREEIVTSCIEKYKKSERLDLLKHLIQFQNGKIRQELESVLDCKLQINSENKVSLVMKQGGLNTKFFYENELIYNIFIRSKKRQFHLVDLLTKLQNKIILKFHLHKFELEPFEYNEFEQYQLNAQSRGIIFDHVNTLLDICQNGEVYYYSMNGNENSLIKLSKDEIVLTSMRIMQYIFKFIDRWNFSQTLPVNQIIINLQKIANHLISSNNKNNLIKYLIQQFYSTLMVIFSLHEQNKLKMQEFLDIKEDESTIIAVNVKLFQKYLQINNEQNCPRGIYYWWILILNKIFEKKTFQNIKQRLWLKNIMKVLFLNVINISNFIGDELNYERNQYFQRQKSIVNQFLDLLKDNTYLVDHFCKQWRQKLILHHQNMQQYDHTNNEHQIKIILNIFTLRANQNGQLNDIKAKIVQILKKLGAKRKTILYKTSRPTQLLKLLEINPHTQMLKIIQQLSDQLRNKYEELENAYNIDKEINKIQIKFHYLLTLIKAINNKSKDKDIGTPLLELYLQMIAYSEKLTKKIQRYMITFSLQELQKAKNLTKQFQKIQDFNQILISYSDQLKDSITNIETKPEYLNLLVLKSVPIWKEIFEKKQNYYDISNKLNFVQDFYRTLSSNNNIQLFMQLYYYNKAYIIAFFQYIIISSNMIIQQVQTQEIPLDLQILIKCKKQQKNLQNQLNRLYLPDVQNRSRQLMVQFFTNSNWQSQILIKNLWVKQPRSSKIYEYMILNDLFRQLQTKLTPNHIKIYALYFNIYEQYYHRKTQHNTQSIVSLKIQQQNSSFQFLTNQNWKQILSKRCAFLLEKAFDCRFTIQKPQDYQVFQKFMQNFMEQNIKLQSYNSRLKYMIDDICKLTTNLLLKLEDIHQTGQLNIKNDYKMIKPQMNELKKTNELINRYIQKVQPINSNLFTPSFIHQYLQLVAKFIFLKQKTINFHNKQQVKKQTSQQKDILKQQTQIQKGQIEELKQINSINNEEKQTSIIEQFSQNENNKQVPQQKEANIQKIEQSTLKIQIPIQNVKQSSQIVQKAKIIQQLSTILSQQLFKAIIQLLSTTILIQQYPKDSIQNTQQYLLIVLNVTKRLLDITSDKIQLIIQNIIYKTKALKLSSLSKYIKDFLFLLEEKGQQAYSNTFCHIFKDELLRDSISVEINSLILNIYQKKKILQKYSGDESNKLQVMIKLQDFIELLQAKYEKIDENEMIKQIISEKFNLIIIQQNNKNVHYLSYKIQKQLMKIEMESNNIMQLKNSSFCKQIMKHFIFNLGKGNLKDKFSALKVIVSNLPVLIPYIFLLKVFYQEKEIYLLDFIIEIIKQRDQNIEAIDFLEICCFDINLPLQIGEQVLFYSDYLCDTIVSRLISSTLNKRLLLCIFQLIKIKKFSNSCLKKINGVSLIELLWIELQKMRQNNLIKEGNNIIIYPIVSILQRQKILKLIQYTYDNYKLDIKSWQNYSQLIKNSIFPFSNIVVNPSVNPQLFKFIKDTQNAQSLVNFKQCYEHLKMTVSQKGHNDALIQDSLNNICIISLFQKIKSLKLEQICIDDKKSSIQIKYFYNLWQHAVHQSNHQQAVNQFNIIFKNTQKKNINNRDNQYCIFENISDDQNSEQSQQDEELNQQINTHRQNRYAPEDFLLKKQKQEKVNEKIQKLIELFSIKNKVSSEKLQNQFAQLNAQLLIKLQSINDKLIKMDKEPLGKQLFSGKDETQMRQKLQLKQLQVDFDYKEFTMPFEEFQEYCLSHVVTLQRLDSQRKDIVRNIEQTMLLKHVQRSISQADNVDYIIDTIDQNYKLLSKPSNTKVSNNSIEKEHHLKQKIKPIKFESSMLPANIFTQTKDQYLLQLLFSLYYSPDILTIHYFVPFLQNKLIAPKLINTFILILRKPFATGIFPDNLYSYNKNQQKWEEYKDADKNEQKMTEIIRERIIKILLGMNECSIYKEDNYLNKKLDYQCLNGIKLTLDNKYIDFSNQTGHFPIYQIIEYAFLLYEVKNKSFDDQNRKIYQLFKGLSDLPEHLVDKLIDFFMLINQIYNNLQQKEQEDNIDHYEVLYRQNDLKAYCFQNLQKLLLNSKIKDKIRSKIHPQNQGINSFLITLLIDTNIYTKQQLIILHKRLISKDQIKSTIMFFCNKAFKIYEECDIIENKQLLASNKKLLPHIVQNIIKQSKLKNQPIYKMKIILKDCSFEFKKKFLQKTIKNYKDEFDYEQRNDQVIAKRKIGIFQSAFEDLRNKPDGFWYEDIQAKFMTQDGVILSGYGKGVAKQWYACVTKGMANLNYGIFMKTSKNYYYLNRQSWINPRHLQFLEFIGKLFALSIIKNDWYMVPNFSILLYKLILSQKIQMSDIIRQFDEGEVLKNIQKLRQYTDDSLFCQNFIFQDKRLISRKNLDIFKRKRSEGNNDLQSNNYFVQEAIQIEQMNNIQKEQLSLQEEKTLKIIKVIKIGEDIELIPGGKNIDVNKENLEDFIKLTKQKIQDILVNGIKQQFEAFYGGFSRIIKPQFIEYFKAQQLRQIAQGNSKISIQDMKQNITIGRGIQKNSPLLEWFWNILQKLSPEDLMCFVQHWTGLPKISADGFKHTKLTLMGHNKNHMFAQTCFNKLLIPNYKTKQQLNEAIKTAIAAIKIDQALIEDD